MRSFMPETVICYNTPKINIIHTRCWSFIDKSTRSVAIRSSWYMYIGYWIISISRYCGPNLHHTGIVNRHSFICGWEWKWKQKLYCYWFVTVYAWTDHSLQNIEFPFLTSSSYRTFADNVFLFSIQLMVLNLYNGRHETVENADFDKFVPNSVFVLDPLTNSPRTNHFIFDE